MSTRIGKYFLEYIIGNRFCNVYEIGHVDEFGRIRGMKLVFQSEDWNECKAWASAN